MKNKSILRIDTKWRDVADLEVDFFFSRHGEYSYISFYMLGSQHCFIGLSS